MTGYRRYIITQIHEVSETQKSGNLHIEFKQSLFSLECFAETTSIYNLTLEDYDLQKTWLVFKME
jgi:hypothetical protein